MQKPTSETNFDVIVIGTGMGGGTFGHAMARAGKRVLFIERGRNPLARPESDAIRGIFPEEMAGAPKRVLGQPDASLLARGGRSADDLIDESEARTRSFTPFLGSGVGGSSALYGMVLERLTKADFDAGWPVSYEQMRAYYEAAEAQYGVRRGASLPPMSKASAELFVQFEAQGLHPYRLPQATDVAADCAMCQSVLCAKGCKHDSGTICVGPAVRDFGAQLFDECEVVRLLADETSVKGVECRRAGETFIVTGEVVALAAGALQTPNLLLRSTSPAWPAGLANRSGLVGRNLMRHFVDLYVITPRSVKGPLENQRKELAFNDFSLVDGERLGTVQSFGRLPKAEVLFESMKHDAPRWLGWVLGLFRAVVLLFLRRMVARSVTLATIIEDDAQETNRVWPAEPGAPESSVRVHSRMSSGDRRRVERMRALMRGVLGPWSYRVVKQAENTERLAHVCGTCRMGTDPETSVVDATNRAHGLANLYIVDSSFFSTSGGTNPSLTIAANALRVASHMLSVSKVAA